ncbi:Sodium/hydrogen exchanger family protein [Trichoderma reesei RUT C-30]|uniref:Sodium/hydrogen exchanger family protein n=2 Tax=Hypocrea jecorina TaxID=51453 RepID=A0A024SB05_HYPJR|nr:Sodium/hydrogen exchanger family protein [Trichoderma reesei RUT C-30]
MATATTSSAVPTSTAVRVAPQGGILEGANPSEYDPKNPLTIFIIQVGLIVIICHILHWPLSKIRQPRVIAEVIGGIILGPSVMGHIPGFREAIFPAASIPNLTLVANIGLVLYLFMIGLETDVRFLLSNWRVATSVAFAGLALPFGVGCGLAWGIYNAFRDDPGIKPIDFSTYMLFVGIAVAITAFPVLCRILTELKLLDTPVGVITLSAGVANDVVGWILLALCVALVNAGQGITALWILLVAIGYIILLVLVVKPVLRFVLRKTNNIENGPSQSSIALILLIALTSAFFTGIIGIHPIFGGFVVGLIIPREHGFNIRVIEKMEDLVGSIFLPLYFTLSGLSTNLGLLNNGTAWGYVFATTIVALTTKIIGASVAARLNGLVWRESFSIGVLMSCKGLVELIVLNIGLQAKILSVRTFTIFVVMALLTTFLTTPAVSFLYPPWYQKKIAAWKRGEIDWDTGAPITQVTVTPGTDTSTQRVRRLLVYLRLDNMPALLNLLSLFGSSHAAETPSGTSEGGSKRSYEDVVKGPVRAHGLRLLELTDRDSSVMTVAQVDEYTRHDPVVNIFRSVGQLHNIAASGEVAIMPEDRFADALVSRSSNMGSDLLLMPWTETGSMGDAQIISSADVEDRLASNYLSFVKSVLRSIDHNVGIFFTRSRDDVKTGKKEGQEQARLRRQYSYDVSRREFPTAPLVPRTHNIFFVYFGGRDDNFALRLVLQLLERERVTATIINVSQLGEKSASAGENIFDAVMAEIPKSMSTRIKVEKLSVAPTVEELLNLANAAPTANESDVANPTLVVLSRGGSIKLDEGKLANRPREDVQGCLGTLAAHFVASGVMTDLLVVQAKLDAAASS